LHKVLVIQHSLWQCDYYCGVFLLTSAELGTVQSNIGTLIKEGLGPRADMDYLLARDTCLALAKLSTKVS